MTEQEIRLAAVQFAAFGNPSNVDNLLANAERIFQFLSYGKKINEVDKQLEIEGNIP